MIEILELRAMLSNYYLSNAGSDTLNDGSQTAPWATLAKVNALALRPGDAVLLNGGDTFAGTLTFDALDGGSSASPVVIESYGAGRATLSAGNASGIVVSNTGRPAHLRPQRRRRGAGEQQYSGIRFDNSLAGNVQAAVRPHRLTSTSAASASTASPSAGSNGKSGFNDVSITTPTSTTTSSAASRPTASSPPPPPATPTPASTSATASSTTTPATPARPTTVGDGIVLSDADGLTIERNVA